MTSTIIYNLKQIIAAELEVNLTPAQIDENASLLEGEIEIDSIAIVEPISVIEEKFGIVFTDEDLVPESFSTISVLAALISAKLDQAPPPVS